MKERIKKIEEELAKMEHEFFDTAEKLINAFPAVICFCASADSVKNAGVDTKAADKIKEDMLTKADQCRIDYNLLCPYLNDKKGAGKLNAKIEKFEKELRETAV